MLRHAALLTLVLAASNPLSAAPNFPQPLPASYVGTLPCADCPGIDTKLNLLPDGQFQLRMTYLEREGAGFYQIGLWKAEKDTLILKDGDKVVEQFQIKGKTHELTKLDMQGQPIQSKLNYTLQHKNVFQPMKPQLTMQGTFVYLADAARFTSCATQLSMPVRMEGDYLTLERAYLAQQKQPAAPMLATVEGQLLLQPLLEREGNELALKVMKFIELSAASTCPAADKPEDKAMPAATPEDRTWNLVQLGDMPVNAPKDRPGAHLVLMSKDKRVAGSGGCNRIMGGYTLEGNTLKFSKMASTMMMCEDSMALEQSFLKALDTVTGWSIEGNTLLLKDASGQVVAKLNTQTQP
jgi:copper homeostasis protein (lipoprotein)